MVSPDDKFYNAKITKRVDIAPDLWTFRINPGGEFRYLPGQYATLGVQGVEKRSERAYSIVSSPYEDELEFFFELVQQGDLTPKLYSLQVGDEMLMRKVPKGRFVLETKTERTNHLLISTVTGLAPFVSYMRTLQRDQKNGSFPAGHKIFLINGASRSWEFGYHGEIEAIAAQSSWLNYVPTISRPWEDEKWQGEVGRVDDLVRKYVDLWGLTAQNATAYVCGHPEMIEHTKGILRRRGFPKENLKEEIYWIPAKKAASGQVQS
jgi:ferredoxin/flavodoxin---NADP+ reductase